METTARTSAKTKTELICLIAECREAGHGVMLTEGGLMIREPDGRWKEHGPGGLPPTALFWVLTGWLLCQEEDGDE